MSKVLCVLYDDPIDGYPRRRHIVIRIAFEKDVISVDATLIRN